VEVEALERLAQLGDRHTGMCDVCDVKPVARIHCDYLVCSSEKCFDVAVDNVSSRQS
jgi:hypothetical protein